MAARAQPRPRRRAVPPLSAEAWADAALEDIGKKGLEGLAVEPLAARLRVTKGSFYWHFRDRRALVKAALERWEQLSTERVISDLESLDDPRARLRRLFQVAFNGPLHIEVALMSAGDDPQVRPIVERVCERRLQYLLAQYQAMGLPAARARAYALHAFSAYLGIQHILKLTPRHFGKEGRADYVKHLNESLGVSLQR
jgi:AcrR family transcriptional regulator